MQALPKKARNISFNELNSTEQFLIEFYSEMEENWLDIFCSIVYINNTKRLLEYALSLGYTYNRHSEEQLLIYVKIKIIRQVIHNHLIHEIKRKNVSSISLNTS